MYKVVRRFKDLKHGGHIYHVGDGYPAEGFKTSKKRLEELSTTKNKYGKIYIEEVADEGENEETAGEEDVKENDVEDAGEDSDSDEG